MPNHKISGFTYIRNGFEYGYPFLQSIQSLLPLVDELVVAVGKSHDGTGDAIRALGSNKIIIIDTLWDETLREGGKIFAQQANIALDAITGDIGFHLQADEVLHENDYDSIREAIQQLRTHPLAEGILFNFLNFYGGYHYTGSTRKWHRKEIRIIKNSPNIRSYRDSQGFRYYPSVKAYLEGHPGRKLNVLYVNASVYHYSYARDPATMQKKNNYFNSFWHDDNWLRKNNPSSANFDYNRVDFVIPFTGAHPLLMEPLVKRQHWEFTFDSSKSKFTPKGRILHWIEKKTGWRIGEYKNYRIVGTVKTS
jgi:glycosyltransferase involved in cell wall biosynthesis